MKFALVYISPNGTTRKTTKILADVITQDGYEVEIFDIGRGDLRFNKEDLYKRLKTKDIVGFGSSAYHMDFLSPMKDLLRNVKGNFKAFLYLNYGGITSGKAFINAAKVLNEANIHIIGALKVMAPHFHHKEEFPTENTIKIINNFYQVLKTNNFAEIKNINSKFKPEKFRVNFLYPIAHRIGKKRELPIEVDHDLCKKCKKCVRECPVGAISFEDGIKMDFSKCIHCYHCVNACPFGAIKSPVEELDKMINFNKKVIGMEDPLNKIII